MIKLSYKYTFLLFVIMAACSGDEDTPSPQNDKYGSLQINGGNEQLGIPGKLLTDTLRITVTPKNSSFKPGNFVIRPRVQKGNGAVMDPYFAGKSPELISADSKGNFKTLWQLGCGDKEQLLSFYLYYTDSCGLYTIAQGLCDPIDSVTFTATAKAPHGWNLSCGITSADKYNTKIHDYKGQLYAVNYGTLYKLVIKEGMGWEKVPGVPSNKIFDFGFTSTGSIYILTDGEGVYRSGDLESWTPVNNGILDPRYPKSLLVEDSVVYVSFNFDGLYRLRPSVGTTWKKLLIDGKYWEEYAFITRHPNGNLYIADKWDTYWVSANSGDSWKRLSLEYKYVNYETEDLKISSAGMIYIGSGDASLAILNPDTYKGEVHSYYQWNASHQTINNIIFRNDGVYYLVNHTPDPGIYTSANGWQKVNIGFGKPIHQFVFDPAGKFLVGSYDGLYYWKE
jgi:hypothetical protein